MDVSTIQLQPGKTQGLNDDQYLPSTARVSPISQSWLQMYQYIVVHLSPSPGGWEGDHQLLRKQLVVVNRFVKLSEDDNIVKI